MRASAHDGMNFEKGSLLRSEIATPKFFLKKNSLLMFTGKNFICAGFDTVFAQDEGSEEWKKQSRIWFIKDECTLFGSFGDTTVRIPPLSARRGVR